MELFHPLKWPKINGFTEVKFHPEISGVISPYSLLSQKTLKKNCIFPNKYEIPKSLQVSHWLRELLLTGDFGGAHLVLPKYPAPPLAARPPSHSPQRQGTDRVDQYASCSSNPEDFFFLKRGFHFNGEFSGSRNRW